MSWLDAAADQRPPLRAGHPGIDLAIEVVVDRSGAACRQVAPDHRPDHDCERRPGRIGDQHRGHRCDQQQRDDARLGERQVVARHLQR